MFNISVLLANLPETSPFFVCPNGFGEHLFFKNRCITLFWMRNFSVIQSWIESGVYPKRNFKGSISIMLQTPNLKSDVNAAHRFWNVTFSEYFIAILFQATFRNNKSSNLHWTLTPLSSVTAAEKSWFSYDLGNARPWEVFWQEKPLQLQLGNIYWNEIMYLPNCFNYH